MIHPTAVIHSEAQIEPDVEIGAFTIVHAGAHIGRSTRIGSHCAIGEPTDLARGRPLILGEGTVIRSHSVVYAGSTFGPGLETGHQVALREGLDVGRNLRVGTRSDLQGDARIGDFVRLHSGVFVPTRTTIHDFVWVFPNTTMTNDPHPPSDACIQGPVIEEFASIGAMSCLAPAVRIGARSFVAAASLVTSDVRPDTMVRGAPARAVGPASSVRLRDGSGAPAYPWTRHFHRGYPADVVAAWEDDG